MQPDGRGQIWAPNFIMQSTLKGFLMVQFTGVHSPLHRSGLGGVGPPSRRPVNHSLVNVKSGELLTEQGAAEGLRDEGRLSGPEGCMGESDVALCVPETAFLVLAELRICVPLWRPPHSPGLVRAGSHQNIDLPPWLLLTTQGRKTWCGFAQTNSPMAGAVTASRTRRGLAVWFPSPTASGAAAFEGGG
ncbi:hypothetical protein Cadr_000002563 [Camelus dromedarius]|uniref:Uncharacterized protein n=1 Tax=Camelus dromedarius TaxID=9838 RepID=A0A5N4C3I1_CAMDR|nr:hypothetical protein Cadr_000002563 [Camelus dromedarius]